LDYIAYDKYVKYGIKVRPLPEDIEQEMLRVAEAYYDEEAAKDSLYAEIIQSQRDFAEICEFHDIR